MTIDQAVCDGQVHCTARQIDMFVLHTVMVSSGISHLVLLSTLVTKNKNYFHWQGQIHLFCWEDCEE